MESKKVLTAKILIAIIVVLVILVLGLGAYIMFLTKNNTKNQSAELSNNASQNSNTVSTIGNSNTTDTNATNITGDANATDPYSNYPNFAWTRTTSINYPATDPSFNPSFLSAWIDNSGIINVSFPADDSFPKKDITIDSFPEKAKYIKYMTVGQAAQTGDFFVLTESNNLYIISEIYGYTGYYDNVTPDIQKIASNIIDIYIYNNIQFYENSEPSLYNETYVSRNTYWNLCINWRWKIT
ncbi:MAG: hypothetical protein FWF46_04170 [Oscillospiraceae bacterium]|nr:hypothetical protein [Oscillospiraceae bacterium]